MNRIFGFSRNALALAGIVVAIILVVIVGMIIIGSAAIRALMTSGLKVEGISLLALLVTIIVLLAAVFIMLLVLFWCCCKKERIGKGLEALRGLAGFLPFLRDAAAGLETAAAALDSVAGLVRQTRTKVDWAGGAVRTAGDNVDVDIPTVTWTPGSVPSPGGPITVITGITAGTVKPFVAVTAKLHETADHLNANVPESVTSRLDNVAVKCEEAAGGLRAVKSLLDAVS